MSLAGALPRLSNQDLARIRLDAEERLLRHRGAGPNCQSCRLHRELASMAQEIAAFRSLGAAEQTAPDTYVPDAKPNVGDELTADALAACPWVIEYEVLEDHTVDQDGHRVRVLDRVRVLSVRTAPEADDDVAVSES